MLTRASPKLLNTLQTSVGANLSLPTPVTPYTPLGNSLCLAFKNGKLIESYDKDSNSFLLDFPRGAYTTMRTLMNQKAIFQYKHHIGRLKQSSTVMMEEHNNTTQNSYNAQFKCSNYHDQSQNVHGSYDISLLSDELLLSETIKNVINDNVLQFRKNAQSRGIIEGNNDLKITALVTWQQYV
jgi:hypothetical protein